MKIFGVSRVRAVVSAVVVLLLVVQGVTYRFRAEATMPLAGIGHLAMYDVVRGGGFVVMDSVMWAFVVIWSIDDLTLIRSPSLIARFAAVSGCIHAGFS